MSDTEAEIAKLGSIIQIYEDTDPYFTHPSLKDLRNKIMYVHSRIEATAEWLILGNIFEYPKHKQNALESAKSMFKLLPLFNKLEFYPKIEICVNQKLINGKDSHKLLMVNDLRVHFSHPKTFHSEINKLKDRKLYLATLITLVNALRILDRITSQ